MTEVHLYKLPEISEQEICRLSRLVSDERKAKIQRLKKRENKLQSLFAALLLRAVLCDRLKADNGELNFSVGAKGKPYLKDSPDIHFSISHTESFVAVAVSDTEVGIDAEQIKPADKKLCRRYFSESEQAFVSPDTDGWLDRFYLVWTRKEAYVKYTGDGLSVPLSSFSTVENDGRYKTFDLDRYKVSLYCDGDISAASADDTEMILENFIKKQLGN